MSEGPEAEIGLRAVPAVLDVTRPSEATLEFLDTVEVRDIGEIGIYKGLTSERLAAYLAGRGELHLFDYDDVVEEVVGRLHRAGYERVVGHGNSRKLLDSYNWSLMKLVRDRDEPMFDYVFLDGAHTWAVDALAFFLVDRLLRVGGFLDIDDYWWSLARSPTMNPGVFPVTSELYPEEQIDEPQVALVVDLLVRRDARYEEVVENRIFKKVAE